MGYTHYWTQTRDFTTLEWAELAKGFFALIANRPPDLALCAEHLGEEPFFDMNEPWFNGIGDEGHETFTLQRQRTGFDFCKTAQKPYDLMVCAMLLYVENKIPGVLEISSDGDEKDWHDAWKFLGETFPNPDPGKRWNNWRFPPEVVR